MLPDGWKPTTLGKVCEWEITTRPLRKRTSAYQYHK